jgi:signal transduction histidine kinase
MISQAGRPTLLGRIREIAARTREWIIRPRTRRPKAGDSTVDVPSDLLRIETALRQSEQRFVAFMDNFPGPAFIKDDRGRLVYLNRAAKLCTPAHIRERCMGRTARELYEPPVAELLERHDRHVLQTGETIQALELIPLDDGLHDYLVNKFRYRTPGPDGSSQVWLGGIALDVTEHQRDKRRLRAQAQELTRADSRERRRVANLLHDDVGQMLAAALMEVQAARGKCDADGDGSLDRIALLLQRTLETTRSLTVQLCPPVLRELGLLPALRWLATQVLDPRGIACEFELDEQLEQLDPRPMNEETCLIVFQSVRELLVNVVKHSRASRVVLTGRRVGGQVELTIADNGVGFDPHRCCAHDDPDDSGNHFGLFNVREQIGYVGGTVDIQSGPNRSTRIRLIVPTRALQ